LQQFLSDLGCVLTEEDHCVQPLVQVTPTSAWLDEQQLHSGLLLLSWNFSKEALAGLQYVDPLLSSRWWLSLQETGPEAEAQTAKLKLQLLACRAECTRLLVPVFAAQHWTLLSVDFEGSSVKSVRYRDSLTVQTSDSLMRAQAMLQALTEDQDQPSLLPQRCNFSFQASGSNTCGFWVLAWAEEEMAEFVGEGPAARGPPGPRVPLIRGKLSTFTRALSQELHKLEADKEGLKAKYLKKLELAKKSAAALAAGESAKREAAQAALEAEVLVSQGLAVFGEDQLSASAKLALSQVRLRAPGICSRCRWSSGCLSCDPEKCLKY
jgi:hypothetical protein